MKRSSFSLLTPLLTLPLLTLPLLLTACVPAPLQTRFGSDLALSARLIDNGSKVSDGHYRRPGPVQLSVQVAGTQAPTYLYALLLPKQAAAQLLTPSVQPAQQTALFNLPPVTGYTQVFVVGSPRPLTFPVLGSSVNKLAETVKLAAAELPSNSWNVVTQVYRVGDYGSLKVLTDPSEVSVYLDGTYRGTTPLTLSDVPAGSATLRLERTNFESLTKTVQVPADQTLQVKAALRYSPPKGRLSVSSSMAARVQVLGKNGELRGATPLSADLPAGDYDLTITPLSAGLKAAWLGVTLSGKQTLNVSCQPEGEQLSCQSQ
ncbi:PEGA domain-containing protein [Deinococcus detaillensis]|uniref:PEGA domain-containing protein n=1 Tax=Deinococcus detaillensis TaxID=2592048 RepID=A0A553UW78_9DEIO|nr:PEGA domain-containing protein [Deinococcus detaillensis]TSA84455.1 PEGA domain-containing protein [Deinococcus detaillensis]